MKKLPKSFTEILSILYNSMTDEGQLLDHMPYALLSCSFVTLLYCYSSLNGINGEGGFLNFVTRTSQPRRFL